MARNLELAGHRGLTIFTALLVCVSAVAAPQATIEEPDSQPERRLDDATVESVALGGIDAQAAALLVSGQSGGDVEGAVVWTVTSMAEDGFEAAVPFIVELDAPTLLGRSADRRTPIEFYGYLVDRSGSVVQHISEGVVVESLPEAQAGVGPRLRFIGEFRLQPGLYSLRILVRNHVSGRFFLTRKDLSIPGEETDGLFLLPPLVAAASTPSVNIAQHGLDPPSIAASLAGLETWPSARPALPVAGPLEVVIGCSGIDDIRRLTGRVVNVVGRSVQTLKLRVVQQIVGRDEPAFYRVSTPAMDLPAGRYRLVVELEDRNSGRSVSQSLPIVLYSDLWQSEHEDRPSAGEPDVPPGGESEALETADISRTYEHALRLFAERDPVPARNALAELERRVIAQTPTRHWSKLREAELAVARTLVKAEPASVVALILVHREMFSWYRTRQEPGLSDYSWTQAAAMADGVSTIPDWEPPEGFVECILLDLAGDLVRQGDVRRGQVLLERAVQLEPSEQATRFALGVVLELSGQWYEAARNLQALVDKYPAHYEGRLRLAVNRYRLGSARAAERLLRQLVAEAAPEWIVTLAYQELAQLMVDEERNDEAVLLLRDAMARFPRNQRIRIELAYALDAARHPIEAAELVDALESSGGQLETSPRVRYAEWPVFESERVCGNLEQARRDGLEALMRALP